MKRKANTKSVTVRLDLDINNLLDKYREATLFSKSLLVNSALNYFVKLSDEDKFTVIKDYVILVKNQNKKRG